MKKPIAIICLTAALFMLAGCNEGQTSARQAYAKEFIRPDISILGKDLDTIDYFYVVDNSTGVVYLQFDGFRRAGITVLYNLDGTLLTVDQLKKRKLK